MGGAGRASAVVAGLALLAASACDMPADAPAAKPQARPSGAAQPAAPAAAEPSAESRALSIYYARVENDLRSRGLMRTDGGGVDTPYEARDLARNFERIVFYDEYAPGGGFRASDSTRSALRKWTGPVRMTVEFGETVPDTQRATDAAEVAQYAERLARVTGHPITMAARNANYHVLFMTEDDRGELLRRIRQIEPRVDDDTMEMIRSLPRSIHCLVAAFSDGRDDHTYTRAIALIRAEHPPLTRLACIHEELAQGLGLANDSPRARPSIFNDDDEFALLTAHDEELLRLLYDPALTPGMSADEARPIVARLLRGDPGSS